MSGPGKKSTDIIQERRGKIRTVCYEIVDKRSAPDFLTLRFRERYDDILPYRLMKRATQIDEARLEIVFTEEVVQVEGKRLDTILAGLSDARVIYLREAPTTHSAKPGEGSIQHIHLGSHQVQDLKSKKVGD